LDYGTGVLYSSDGGYIRAHTIYSIFRRKAELTLSFIKKEKAKVLESFRGKVLIPEILKLFF